MHFATYLFLFLWLKESALQQAVFLFPVASADSICLIKVRQQKKFLGFLEGKDVIQ